MHYCLDQVKQKKLSKRVLLGCLLSLFVTQEQAIASSNTKVYKQVGEDGQIEYSDLPSQESTQVILPQIQVNPPAEVIIPAPKEGAKSAEDPKNPNSDQKQEQVSIAISSPIDQQFFTSVMTEVPVVFVVQPKLSPTQKIKLLLDNEPYGEPQNTTNLVLKNLERGTHEIKAMVIDENNQILATSAPVTFQQQRQIVNKKP